MGVFSGAGLRTNSTSDNEFNRIVDGGSLITMKKRDLLRKLSTVTGRLLRDKGYISYPDVFQDLGYLDQNDYESWRFRRVPYLEKVVQVNLSRISFIMKTVRRNSLNGKLKPSHTGYVSWGKGRKVRLRFTRRGVPAIEELWATHFVRTKIMSPKGRNTMKAGDDSVADTSAPMGIGEPQRCSTLESSKAFPQDRSLAGEEIR